jgi:hypothetical protein
VHVCRQGSSAAHVHCEEITGEDRIRVKGQEKGMAEHRERRMMLFSTIFLQFLISPSRHGKNAMCGICHCLTHGMVTRNEQQSLGLDTCHLDSAPDHAPGGFAQVGIPPDTSLTRTLPQLLPGWNFCGVFVLNSSSRVLIWIWVCAKEIYAIAPLQEIFDVHA